MPPKYINLIATKKDFCGFLGCKNPDCPHIKEWIGTSIISLVSTKHDGIYCFENCQNEYNKPNKKQRN